jgi:hypothetical protein
MRPSRELKEFTEWYERTKEWLSQESFETTLKRAWFAGFDVGWDKARINDLDH